MGAETFIPTLSPNGKIILNIASISLLLLLRQRKKLLPNRANNCSCTSRFLEVAYGPAHRDRDCHFPKLKSKHDSYMLTVYVSVRTNECHSLAFKQYTPVVEYFLFHLPSARVVPTKFYSFQNNSCALLLNTLPEILLHKLFRLRKNFSCRLICK